MKNCISCGDTKPLDSFYKHKQTKDGHLNKCKECCKKQARSREKRLRCDDPAWAESERERARDKYLRLDYKSKQKEWDSKRPWKNYSEYKNQARDLSLPDGFEIHHWSYKKKNIRSVFILSNSSHRKAHSFLIFNENERCFEFEGTLLDTKLKHESFLKLKNLI